MTPPRSIILCTTPRSGSTLLCTLLRRVEGAGNPESWFRTEDRADFGAGWGLPPDPDFASYLAAATRAGQGAGGTFALRMMANNLPELITDLAGLYGPDDDPVLLARAFGPPAYIRLIRQDRVAQAVSRYRAEASGLWHRHADGRPLEMSGDAPRAAPYDRGAIARYRDEIDALNTQWDEWFGQHGLTPLQVTYEALSADPAGTVRGLLAALGLPAQPVPAPGTARLADAQSADWAARFRDETGRD